MAVTVPRVRDRTGQGIRFESQLVPTYVRRAKSIDAVLPWLYLRGISQADTGPALEALVGKDVANLSGAVVGKHKVRIALLNETDTAIDLPDKMRQLPLKYNGQTTLEFDVPTGGVDNADFDLKLK